MKQKKWYGMYVYTLLFLFLLSASIFQIPVEAQTRRMERARPVISLGSTTYGEGSGSLTAFRGLKLEARGKRMGTVFLLVNIEIYQKLAGSIRTYAEDLAKEGFTTYVYSIRKEGSLDPFFYSLRNLKSLIREQWLHLVEEHRQGKLSFEALDQGTGVILVGKLPLPLVHSRGGNIPETGDPYEGISPFDIYLTDMDGDWSYTDNNGFPFFSTVDPEVIPPDSECAPGDEVSSTWSNRLAPFMGSCAAKPEIWIGRIDAGPVSNGNQTQEIRFIERYFLRNHTYRTQPRATTLDRLAYFDDDFARLAPATTNAHASVWPGPLASDNNDVSGAIAGVNRYVNNFALTQAEDYLARLESSRYGWVESLMHSNPEMHDFKTPAQGFIYPSLPSGGILLKPLIQYWSPQREDNILVATEPGKTDATNSGYQYVRVEGYIPIGLQMPGTFPLELYWNPERGDNITTATLGGKESAKEAGYHFVRVEGYVSAVQMPGMVPLELYWNNQRQDNFTTATEQGKQSARDAGYNLVEKETLTSAILKARNLKTLYYYIQGCSACRYTEQNNLCSTYLFNGDTLTVLGNTTVGAHDNGEFYQALGQGKNLGQALMLSQRAQARLPNWKTTWEVNYLIDPKRYYSQTLLGDPTLKPNPTFAVRSISAAVSQLDSADALVALEARARVQQAAEKPQKLKRIEKMPPAGVDFTSVTQGEPIVDPQWRYSPDPKLKAKGETFLRTFRTKFDSKKVLKEK